MIYLDTHIVAWMYAGKIEFIPGKIQRELAREELLISPMVLLELQYLFETGRVSARGEKVFQDISKRVGLKICELPFDQVIKQAVELNWTRDPFDRLIVAQARVHSSKLVTKDSEILRNYNHALWG